MTPRRSRRSGASPAELEAIERRFEREERAVGEAAASGEAWRLHQARARLRRDSDLLKRWRETRDRAPVKLLVRVLRIGEVAIVSFPGEYGRGDRRRRQEESPFEITLFTGYSNGQGGG